MGGVEVFLCTFFLVFLPQCTFFLVIALFIYKQRKKYIKKRLELLITIALVLCALFCLLTFFNVSWFVVLFASHCLETIIGLILGFAVAILIYDNEDNDEKR